MTAPFDAKALFEYSSEHADDLSFKPDQIIHVTSVEDEEWLSGWYEGPGGRCEGMFPKNYVEALPAVPVPPRPQGRPTHARGASTVKEQDTEHAVKSEKAQEPAATKVEEVKPADSATKDESIKEEAKEEPSKPISKPTEAIAPVTQETSPVKATPAAAPAATPAAEPEQPEKQDVAAESPSQLSKPAKTNAFRDRIAAFNKAESAPIAPRTMAKPVLAKKPFVAPPPSKDAFIPTPQAKPKSIATHAESSTEPIAVESYGSPVDDMSAPKIGSLKDRIAALQAEREQLAAKKETPVRDPDASSIAEHAEPAEMEEEADSVASPPPMQPLTRMSTARSMDSTRSIEATLSRQTSAQPVPIPALERQNSITVTSPLAAAESHDPAREAMPAAEDAQDDEVDEEEQRKQRLRERMARMSGMGMGMHMALGLPTPAAKPRSAVPASEAEQAPAHHEAPVAAVPMPGLPSAPPVKQMVAQPIEADEDEDADASSSPSDAEEPDSEAQPAEASAVVNSPRVSHGRPSVDLPTPGNTMPSPSLMSPGGSRRMSYFGAVPSQEASPISPRVQQSGPLPSIPDTARPAAAPPVPVSGRPGVPIVPAAPVPAVRSAPPVPVDVAPSRPSLEQVLEQSVQAEEERAGYEADADDDTDSQSVKPSDTEPNMMPTPRMPPPPPPAGVLPVPVTQTTEAPLSPPPMPSVPRTAVPAIPMSRAPPPPVPSMPAPSQPPPEPLVRQVPADSLDEDEQPSQLPTMPTHNRRQSTMRSSMDAGRRPSTDTGRSVPRRSVETRRDHLGDYLASDLAIASTDDWVVQQGGVPPALLNRADLIFEVHEGGDAARDGEDIAKEILVLYQDYSQTTVTVTRDGPGLFVDQAHQVPPTVPARERLEAEYDRFGPQIVEAARRKLNSTVGNGDAISLIAAVFAGLPLALPPIGLRTFGVPIYTNIGNASVQVLDEIRPGDVIAFRNAKLTGHKGAMKSKYSLEVGKPDHCAVVLDWDGTKKKVRVLEQGRDSRKVAEGSFKLKDLKSGEVKVFRVVSRQYCGWPC